MYYIYKSFTKKEFIFYIFFLESRYNLNNFLLLYLNVTFKEYV